MHSARHANQLGRRIKVQSEITGIQSNSFIFAKVHTTTPHNFKTHLYVIDSSKQLTLVVLVLLVHWVDL